MDTETSGLDWKIHVPVGYVLGGDDEPPVWVPVRCGGGGNLLGARPISSPTDKTDTHPFEVAMARAFKERTGRVIGHNTKFDWHFFMNAGVDIGRDLVCTAVTQTLLDEFMRSFSLDACCKVYGLTAKLGDDLYKHMSDKFGGAPDRKIMEKFWMLSGDDPVSIDYACGDIVSTSELYRAQLGAIEDQGLEQIYNLEREVLPVLCAMERRGIRVDTDYLDEMMEEVRGEVSSAYASLPSGFNVRSPKDVKNLCTQAGFVNWPKTDLGNPSFTEAFLSTFDDGRRIVNVRKMTNLLNSFAMPLRDEHVFGGRVHSNINQSKGDEHGTISGRLSYNSPNLQQIPSRDKKISQLLRKAFIADDGMQFWEADQSQAEPRLFAHYSKDTNLTAGYNKDPYEDVHAMASRTMGLHRDLAKRLNMGIFTGMQVPSLAEHLGIPKSEAQDMFNVWHANFPGVGAFQNKARDVFKGRGFVKTLLGRKCRLDSPRFAYRATSRIIQGGGADILKNRLVAAHKFCESSPVPIEMLATVHDAFVWQAEDSDKGRAASRELVKVLEDVKSPPINLTVPIPVDAHFGNNWWNAKSGKED